MASRKRRSDEPCPEDVTFEKGTLGRIILVRGLRLEWGDLGSGPVAVLRDHWKRMFITDIPAPNEGPRPGLREILKVLGKAALTFRNSRMDPAVYAEQVGADPKNPAIKKEFEELSAKMWHFRNFL